MAASFIPTQAVMPSSVLPSQRLASVKNQQLGGLMTSGGAPAPAGGSIGVPTPAPSTIRAKDAQSVALSPLATHTVGINQKVAAGNARLSAIQKAAAPKVSATQQLQGYTGTDKRIANRGPQISIKDTVRVGNAYLRKDAGNAFIQMASAFKQATGRSLNITEGWRSYDDQVRLYKLYRAGKGNLAAKPGTSTHGKGTAVDINGYGDPNGSAFKWLQQNAGNFGYKWTGGTFSQIEPWHWDYVG